MNCKNPHVVSKIKNKEYMKSLKPLELTDRVLSTIQGIYDNNICISTIMYFKTVEGSIINLRVDNCRVASHIKGAINTFIHCHKYTTGDFSDIELVAISIDDNKLLIYEDPDMKDKHKLVTVGDINCPVCGQTLVRLDEDCNGHSEYWCDICHLNIAIEDDRFEEVNSEDNDFDPTTAPLEEPSNKASILGLDMEDLNTLSDLMKVYKIYDCDKFISLMIKATKESKPIDKIIKEYNLKTKQDPNDILPMIEARNIDWKNTDTLQMTVKFVNHNLTIGDTKYEGLDETQFDVNSIEEAVSCWHQFCKENNLNWNCVESVEFDITDYHDSKIGEIDDAIMNLIYSITNRAPSDSKIYDVVQTVHQDINKSLSKMGYKVFAPGIKINPDGSKYMELYE